MDEAAGRSESTRRRGIRGLIDAARARGLGLSRRRLDERGDSEDLVPLSGDDQKPRASYAGKNGRPNQDAFGSDRLPKGLAFNPLSKSIDKPFGHVPADVRKRIERKTGRSLEASYEGLMRLFIDVIDDVSEDDQSRPAKHRKRKL